MTKLLLIFFAPILYITDVCRASYSWGTSPISLRPGAPLRFCARALWHAIINN